MARPISRNGSFNVYFRERIPADVIANARGQTLAIPVGDDVVSVALSETANEVKLSLRTTDRGIAAARHRQVASHLSRVWEGLRQAPERLSHRQAVALAGKIYKLFTAALEDNPGSPQKWERVRSTNVNAQAGKFGMASLMIGEENRIRGSLETRFGGFADAVLAREGLSIDAESRTRLIEQVAKAIDLAAARLQQNADGNYSPDSNAQRFGDWHDVRSAKKSASHRGLTWELIVGGWAREVAPKAATRDQWARYLKDLEQVTGVADPSALSRNDVVKWKDRLLERGDSPKTVNGSKLAALKAVLKWAVDNGKITAHVAQGVSVRRKAKPGERMEGFDDRQAAAILSAAEEARSPVYRWIPLLCALSGARVAEIAQLRGEDVRETSGIWHMQIRAEAGSVKNVTSERDVPVHPYLISSGFLEFVDGNGAGPLFFDPRRRNNNARKPQPKIVSKNVASWVNKLDVGAGRENRKDPNHAWRHWFRTKARSVNVLDSVIDHIVGHTGSSIGQRYGESDLATKARAVASIPVPHQLRAALTHA